MIKKLRVVVVVLVCSVVLLIIAQYTTIVTTTRPRKAQVSLSDTASPVAETFKTESNRRSEKLSSAILTNNTVVIDVTGNLSERLKQFNDAIERVRFDTLSKLIDISAESNHNPIFIASDDYIDQLDRLSYIKTVVLPWHHASTTADRIKANLHLQTYFPWTGSHIMCNRVRSRRRRPQLYIRIFRQMKCNENITSAMVPTSINYGHLKANTRIRQKPEFYSEPPPYVIHLHVISGRSYIDRRGHIATGKVQLILDYCYRFKDFQAPSNQSVMSAPYYEEVFAMTHPPGGAFYHGMIEEMPRIAGFVQFLRRHQQVRIHATTNTGRVYEFLRMLGIDQSRVVSGPITAGIIYMPRAASCMMPRVLETQLLSEHCIQYMMEHNNTTTRNRLVLILRSGRRRFIHQPAIIRAVQSAAAEFGLQFTEFRDKPVPPFNNTVMMFHEAVMVVAVHGAGLSNILFSRRGTFIVEVVPNSFITPFCYLQLAHGLGHHWHGIPVWRFGTHVVGVNISELLNVVRTYLQLWRNSPEQR